jgi:hypothetical protein
MNDKTTTTLGRTKLVYNEQGQLISQSLPESAYNRPTPDLSAQLPFPLPRSWRKSRTLNENLQTLPRPMSAA